jgi:hypothetical protein
LYEKYVILYHNPRKNQEAEQKILVSPSLRLHLYRFCGIIISKENRNGFLQKVKGTEVLCFARKLHHFEGKAGL